VSINNEHANTTYVNFIRGLIEVADVTFYGPGYSTNEELHRGLRAFCEEHEFDAVILSFFFAKYRSEFLEIRYAYSEYRYIWCDYSLYDAIRYIDSIVEDISRLNIVKAVLYVDDILDMHQRWDENIRDLMKRGMYLIAPGEDFIPKISQKYLEYGQCGASNRYETLVKGCKEKIISIIVYAVSYDEFFWGPLGQRPYDWCVPGNLSEEMYPQRGKILDQLKKSQYKIFDEYVDRELPYRKSKDRIQYTLYQREMDKAIDAQMIKYSPYMNARVSRESIAMWRENYNRSLRESRVGYADGSFAHCIVKKYFEIPARGMVLACDEIPPLQSLGFINNENMVIVDTDNIEEVSKKLFADPDRMQDIADKGRRLVLEKHTSRQRAMDTVTALETIARGNYLGTYWKDGDFKIISSQDK